LSVVFYRIAGATVKCRDWRARPAPAHHGRGGSRIGRRGVRFRVRCPGGAGRGVVRNSCGWRIHSAGATTGVKPLAPRTGLGSRGRETTAVKTTVIFRGFP